LKESRCALMRSPGMAGRVGATGFFIHEHLPVKAAPATADSGRHA
jgi:hypothetical protein